MSSSFAAPCRVAHQTPCVQGISQATALEWVVIFFSRDHPQSGIELTSAWQADSLSLGHQGSPLGWLPYCSFLTPWFFTFRCWLMGSWRVRHDWATELNWLRCWLSVRKSFSPCITDHLYQYRLTESYFIQWDFFCFYRYWFVMHQVLGIWPIGPPTGRRLPLWTFPCHFLCFLPLRQKTEVPDSHCNFPVPTMQSDIFQKIFFSLLLVQNGL